MMNSYFWIHILNIKIIGPRKGHPFPLLLAILLPWQPRALAIAFSTMEGFTLLVRPGSSWKGAGRLLETGKCGLPHDTGHPSSSMHPSVVCWAVVHPARLGHLCQKLISGSHSAIYWPQLSQTFDLQLCPLLETLQAKAEEQGECSCSDLVLAGSAFFITNSKWACGGSCHLHSALSPSACLSTHTVWLWRTPHTTARSLSHQAHLFSSVQTNLWALKLNLASKDQNMIQTQDNEKSYSNPRPGITKHPLPTLII